MAAAADNQESQQTAPLDWGAVERIEIQPARIDLHRSRDRAMVLVTGYFPGGVVVDVTHDTAITTSNPNVAAYKNGAIIPAGSGQCELQVALGPHKATIPITVDAFDQPAPVSFRTETVAALTRQACNSGACHGSPSGKGGFQLSLQAYDHAMDEATLTRAEKGRRLNPIDPDRSLLLLKPTMAVPHRGGLQLRTTDYAYEVLRQWIAEGGTVDAAAGTRCVSLELLPASGRVLTEPHLHQQIVALAHFDNGVVRDVTRLTKFTSSDEAIASVSAGGLLTGHRRGQVAVMARYLDQLVSCQFTLTKKVAGFQWPNPPAANYVDDLVYEKLQQLEYEPSALCSDTEFLRRVYLDVIGMLPTIAEQNEFLADTSPDRRDKLIDKLLDRPEHAQFWALKWGDLLRLQKSRVRETGVYKFYQWLVDVFQTNQPFNEFATELLTAQGSTYEHPAANYYRTCADPIEAAETTAQIFLGSRIQCAKCHNHPFENWTQDNFYGLTAFFQRVNRKPGLRLDEEIVFVGHEGEVRQPRTGQLMQPWLPGQGSLDAAAIEDRRRAFAVWLTSPTNPYFARVAVNRFWNDVMGQGIVDPVDDFRQSNPPANPALLDRLAADFVQHGFDQRYLLKTILQSRTYQLSSEATTLNEDDSRHFSHAKVRSLTAEQLLDAVCHVTLVPETFAGLPLGTHATEMPSPDVKLSFLDTFGRPARNTACECERGTASTLAQAIELFNGQLVQRKLADKKNRFYLELAAGKSHAEIVEQLYRSALCREPTAAETQTALDHIASKEKPGDGFEDVCWALLNTQEFLSQH
ncbi:MAG: DUF1549 and DUF1553 domain-containing protein [Pirellulales bacterium]